MLRRSVVAADQNYSYAVLPELDGTSRLWIASKPELGEPAQRTDLVSSEPHRDHGELHDGPGR